MINIETYNEGLAQPMAIPSMQYKDRVFRMLFKEKKELLELYNALNESSYENPEELVITTLEKSVYMGMKNDVSFIFYGELVLYEHQSTRNPNMPLRDLFYVSSVYQKQIVQESLYSTELVKIPAPKFVVFYNGKDTSPERQVLKLSDAYEPSVEEPDLELKVLVLNINKGYNEKVKERCQTLREYMQFVDCVREFEQQMPFREAVNMAVNVCISKGILADFLRRNKAEVIAMSIFEYDEAKLRQIDIQTGRTEGRAEGRADLIKNALRDGKAPETVATFLDIPLEEVLAVVE